MIVKLLIRILLPFVESLTDLPSTVIWKNVDYAIEKGKIVIPKSKKYLIFDQENYIKEKKDSAKMKVLYDMQELLSVNYTIFTYIFLVDYIDEKQEDLESCAIKLSVLIFTKFGTLPSNTFISLFSMNSKRLRIQPGGDISSKYTDSISMTMINNFSNLSISRFDNVKLYDTI